MVMTHTHAKNQGTVVQGEFGTQTDIEWKQRIPMDGRTQPIAVHFV